MEERAAKQKIPVSFDEKLTDEAHEAWADQIDQLVFKGSAYIEEVVFFHKDSQTLILTDLIENFEAERFPSPLRSKAYKLVRVAAPDGQTPIDYRMTFIGHQKEAKDCLEQMLAWKPEKIILAHGRCFLENGVAELRRALRWIR